MTIDWTKPIEAVYADGRVFPARVESEPGVNCYRQVEVDDLSICGVNQIYVVRENGERVFSDDIKIRNRAEPANDELAELRAFKEAAIARFPELDVVIDSDFAEAKNLMQESDWGSGTECSSPNDPNFEGSVCDVVLKAIKRGRELERYAQGLTTPKD